MTNVEKKILIIALHSGKFTLNYNHHNISDLWELCLKSSTFAESIEEKAIIVKRHIYKLIREGFLVEKFTSHTKKLSYVELTPAGHILAASL